VDLTDLESIPPIGTIRRDGPTARHNPCGPHTGLTPACGAFVKTECKYSDVMTRDEVDSSAEDWMDMDMPLRKYS